MATAASSLRMGTSTNYHKVAPGECDLLESGSAKPSAPATDFSKGGIETANEFQFDATAQQFTAAARLGFVRKVFGILTAQLVLTCAVSALFMLNVAVRGWVLATPSLMMFSFVGSMVTLVLCAMNKDSFPKNLYYLGAFTLFEALSIGVVCAAYAQRGIGGLVLQAATLTMVTFLSLTAYTMQSGIDFSFMGAGLYSGLCCMLGYGLISMLFGFSTGGLYSMFGAILFCGFIIYDVDQTMHKIGVDDYVMAAINIYLDIINLFLFILQMLSSNDR